MSDYSGSSKAEADAALCRRTAYSGWVSARMERWRRCSAYGLELILRCSLHARLCRTVLTLRDTLESLRKCAGKLAYSRPLQFSSSTCAAVSFTSSMNMSLSLLHPEHQVQQQEYWSLPTSSFSRRSIRGYKILRLKLHHSISSSI